MIGFSVNTRIKTDVKFIFFVIEMFYYSKIYQPFLFIVLKFFIFIYKNGNKKIYE